MKIFKKFVSVLLASVMCIPSSIFSLAYAAEMDTDESYTVALKDAENGIVQFSEACMEASTASQDGYHMVRINDDGEAEQIENDGSLWAFSKGDEVEIELIPDEGYGVSSFSIVNASTGREMAHEDTTDNVFSFVMPAKNVTIEASFVKTDNDEDTEKDFTVDEENNIITENEDGRIVYRRIELADDEAVSLQDRINSLPDAEELYYNIYMEDEDYIAKIEAEVDDISNIYFNELTDNERAQIDSSPLFAALMTLDASDVSPESNETPDDTELKALQERIDALAGVSDIAEAEGMEDDYVLYNYGSEDGDMFIPNENQDELFLEVMDLAEKVFALEPEYAEQLDTGRLEDMYRFFTGGHTESVSENDGAMWLSEDADSGIMLLADPGAEDLTKGWYNHSGANNPYRSSFFVGKLEETGDMLTMYCGRAGVKAFSHAGSPVNFLDGGHVEEIFHAEDPEDPNNVARASGTLNTVSMPRDAGTGCM